MAKLKEYKNLTEDKPITPALLPKQVFIHLTQHIGKAANPIIKIGDIVLAGQCIATSEAAVSSPVHASVSGHVTAIEDYPHPSLGESKAIVIDNDGLDKKKEAEIKSPAEIEKLTADEIRNIVQRSGIIGMGGAAFPSHIKLTPPKPVETLILNGAECEPYLTSDYRLMVEKTKEILLGARLISRCLSVKQVYIAIEDNKPEAIKKFTIHGSQFTVKVLKSSYPQGGEKQLIKNVLGKEVPSGKLPFDAGVVVHNVSTAYAIYEAVYKDKPLYERVVTVTGSCLANPKNFLARIGTPVKDLIDECSPLKEEPFKIIIGGPMMGIAQGNRLVPLIKASGGIILLTKKEAQILEEDVCIRCGACVRECPAGLMPTIIDAASRKEYWQLALAYGAQDCIECGLCAYVCPTNRYLVQSIKLAKSKMDVRNVPK